MNRQAERLLLLNLLLLVVVTLPLRAGVYGGGGGKSALTLLSTLTGDGSSGTFTFSNISGTYNHLEIWLYARTDTASQVEGVNIRFNNDSGTNYDQERFFGESVSSNADHSEAQTSGSIGGTIAAASADTGVAGFVTIRIPMYAATTLNKVARSEWDVIGVPGTGWRYCGSSRVSWRSTAAITRVDLISASGGKYITGSVAHLYGRN